MEISLISKLIFVLVRLVQSVQYITYVDQFFFFASVRDLLMHQIEGEWHR